MSDFRAFFKENKKQKEHQFYAATKSICDEKGEPLKWELRQLTSREVDEIRDQNTVEVQIPGKPGMYRNRVNTSRMNLDMVCASIVSPDLNNAKLQDSYGVKTAGDLLQEMIDNPGEYMNLVQFVTEMNGYDLDEEVEAVKN